MRIGTTATGLICSCHIDHAASLPYIMEKVQLALKAELTVQTNFKDGGGKVYMTSPTKEVYRILMRDFVRMRCVARTRRD